MRMMVRFWAFLFVLIAADGPLAFAWKLCAEDEGGGICPDETTCCSTGVPGQSQCIPLVHTNSPAGQPNGLCCGDSSACRFGYECAVSKPETNLRSGFIHGDRTEHPYCRATDVARFVDPLARDTPRYDLCHIPEGAAKVHGFPVPVSPTDNDDVFHLAYLSNVGDIASLEEDSIGYATLSKPLEGIERAIIVIHGSLRDAEDYFCAGLSLLDESHQNSTMVLAPKFVSVHDPMESDESTRFLVWEDQAYANKEYLWHIWRYGADAANAPISSNKALDALVEHLANDKNSFPNLQQITLVGHSAGGQTLQRWSLLSNSPAWNTIDIRVVAANPRSYAYLDGRRWLADGKSRNQIFRLPTPRDKLAKHCPWYNQWLWGLEDGGEVLCPYRDTAVEQAGSVDAIAQRYASRNVTYLSGEYDTVPQTRDHCGNAIQGGNRHERALLFYRGLQEHFGKPDPPVHTFYTIPKSNHDHALMFQSPLGREAILGLSFSVTNSSTMGENSAPAEKSSIAAPAATITA